MATAKKTKKTGAKQVATNITKEECKRIERQFKECNKEIEQIMCSSAIPMYIINKDHTIAHWNKALENMTDLQHQEMIGTKHHWKAFYKTKHPLLADLIIDKAPQKKFREFYGEKVSKSALIDGAWEATDFFPNLGEEGKWLYFTAAPLKNDKGKLEGVLVTLQDVTNQKVYEETLKGLDELKSKFITIVSHQIRTPLTSIRWNLENLLDGTFGELEEAQKNFIRSIHDAEAELISRLTDLLLVVDIEERRISIDAESISLESLCGSVMKEYEKKAGLKQIKFKYIPPETPLPEMMVDRNKMRDVFVQLMRNAIDYTEEKGTIAAKLFKKGDMVRFEVKDNGIGIPKVEQPRIFTRFFRASNAALMETDRSGLGLTIAQYYVEKHGGKIGFTSADQKGSTFWVEIPIKSK
ncbi:MAG: PAS domain-containing sensor histidine kinase [Candidatus Kerfeldbacteria bacterium]